MPATHPSRHHLVVGVGADGWAGLAEPVRALITSASVLVGAERLLSDIPVSDAQTRLSWPSPFSLALLDAEPEALVLASGDPMVSGVGTSLIRRYGAAAVEVVPHVSSVALARARMGWSEAETAVVSKVGRPLAAVRRELAPGRRVLVLSADETTPAAVAALLVDAGCGDSVMTVLGDLGGPDETRRSAAAGAWDGRSPRLNIVAVEVAGYVPASWAGGLPDDAFEHDGQLTKRDLRASALARLAPYPGALLWDLGAGAGSVGIEWCRSHPTARAVAVERDATRAERIERNAARLGVPSLRVVRGDVLSALDDLEAPDAIFVGGGATAPGLLEQCRSRLVAGGRLVVHAVTLESERVLADAHRELGGELTRHAVETAAPLGSFTGWTPARAVVQWAWTT